MHCVIEKHLNKMFSWKGFSVVEKNDKIWAKYDKLSFKKELNECLVGRNYQK